MRESSSQVLWAFGFAGLDALRGSDTLGVPGVSHERAALLTEASVGASQVEEPSSACIGLESEVDLVEEVTRALQPIAAKRPRAPGTDP
jgi:hypothetical protein